MLDALLKLQQVGNLQILSVCELRMVNQWTSRLKMDGYHQHADNALFGHIDSQCPLKQTWMPKEMDNEAWREGYNNEKA